MRISDWSSDVCSSDLQTLDHGPVLLAELASGDLLVGVQSLEVLVDHRHADELLAIHLHGLDLELRVLAVDRKSDVQGKRVSVRLDLRRRRNIKKKKYSDK